MRQIAALALTIALGGCYSQRPVALAALEDLTAAPGRPPEVQVAGEECDGCQVTVDATSPLVLTTADGRTHRMTPFYFHMSDTQVVSPDYGVLIDRADLRRAEVRTLSVGGTVALVSVVATVAIGTFIALQATAGEENLGAK